MQQLPVFRLPKMVPLQRERTPQANIPQSRQERERVRSRIRALADLQKPVPPVRLEELRRLAGEFCRLEGVSAKYVDYVGVLLNSEVWRDALAAVPFERRLLLLPKCLREEEHCPAPFDELGLL